MLHTCKQKKNEIWAITPFTYFTHSNCNVQHKDCFGVPHFLFTFYSLCHLVFHIRWGLFSHLIDWTYQNLLINYVRHRENNKNDQELLLRYRWCWISICLSLYDTLNIIYCNNSIKNYYQKRQKVYEKTTNIRDHMFTLNWSQLLFSVVFCHYFSFSRHTFMHTHQIYLSQNEKFGCFNCNSQCTFRCWNNCSPATVSLFGSCVTHISILPIYV